LLYKTPIGLVGSTPRRGLLHWELLKSTLFKKIMQPITYYAGSVEAQNLSNFVDGYCRNLTGENLWDLIAICSARLALVHPSQGSEIELTGFNQVRESLNMSWDAVEETALELLEGITRSNLKQLIMALSAIGADSDIH
jgi:hypothetical protein